ncbi:MAG: hypothetical protein DWQ49_07095 [Bacteroidetes bacterium]|nr:MAG: hypothetical protein DWQ49_07095 [Bacteroidota bacterium]
MAWVTITNNPTWQYNNAPANPGTDNKFKKALWDLQTNGIRSTGQNHEVYVEVRKVGDTNRTRGEMSKTYWDNH